MIPNNRAFFDRKNLTIGDFKEFLTPSPKKEKNKYICPNCGGHNLSINDDDVQYDCYGGCGDTSAIFSILKEQYVRQYDNENESKWNEKKKPKPKGKREYIYTNEGKPYIKITITYKDNGEKNPPFQSRYEDGKWIAKLGETHHQEKAELYRITEVKKAMENDQEIFITEGEGCVETIRDLGLVATTNIGGSGKNYQAYEILKDYPKLVLCPDRDKPGLKHMETIEGMLKHKPKWFYVPSGLWGCLPNNSGTDITDFVIEKQQEGLSKEKIKEVFLAMIGDKKEFKKEGTQKEKATKETKIIPFPSVPIDKDDIKSRLSHLLEQDLKPSQETLILNEIARETGLIISEIKDIYRNLKEEADSQELTIDLSEKLENILDIEKINLDLFSVLPPQIAERLTALASQMKVAPEHLLTAILPTWASMIGTKSQVVISSAMGYTQPSIIRTMIVANSGDRKSPILKNATSAIVEMDADSMKQYKEDLRQYQEAVKVNTKNDTTLEEPKAKRFIMDDFNYDGMIKLHSENETGLLGTIDELKGYFARMNKQTGRGDDEQKDLQLFNGSALIKDRQSKECSFYLAKSALSLNGTIQWEILGKLIKSKGDNDSAGVICRWLMCAKPLGKSKLDLFSGHDDLFDTFKDEQKDLLRWLRHLSKTDFLLNDDAKRLWQQFQHHLEDLREIETNDALSVAYPKFESYMSRLALVLHCVESYYSQELSPNISGQTMKRAIEMTQFYISQYRYVLAKVSPSESLTGDILKIRDLLYKMNSLTVTQVKDRFRHLKGQGKEARGIIVSYFETLINSGFAQWEIEGKKIKIRTNQDTNQDKSGQTYKDLKSININSLKDTEKSKSGQIRTKSGHLKTNNINSLDIESGQNNNFNFFSDNNVISQNQDSNNNCPSLEEDNQENKIVNQEKCPDLVSKASNDKDLNCPDNVLTCPDEVLESSQHKDLTCPDNCPDFGENVLICPDESKKFELGQKWNFEKINGDIVEVEISGINNNNTVLSLIEIATGETMMSHVSNNAFLKLIK